MGRKKLEKKIEIYQKIFEGLTAKKILNDNSEMKNIFENLKKIGSKLNAGSLWAKQACSISRKDWYKKYVILDILSKEELKSKKFPLITFQ